MKFTDNIQIEKESLSKLLLFGFLMLMMGRGSNWVLEIDPRTNPIGVLILFVLLIKVAVKPSYRVTVEPIICFIFLLFGWFIFHLLVDSVTPLYQGLQILIKSILGIFVVKYYGLKFGYYYERTIVFLTIVGLGFWMIQMVIGSGTLASFAPLDCSMHPGTKSFFVYSLIHYFNSETSFWGILRNCGFCWEPGLYASMLIIGITFNIARHIGKGFVRSKNFWILIIGLLTTLSTTGFLCLFVLLLLNSIVAGKHVIKKVFAISFIIVLGLYAASLPFIGDKIERQSDIGNYKINSKNVYVAESGYITVERFEGMYLSWLNVKDKPIMGYGPNTENSLTSRLYPIFRISNGNVNTFSILGIPLAIIFYIFLYKGTKTIIKYCGYSLVSIVFIMFMLFTASYNFTFEILTLAMCFAFSLKNNSSVNC